MGLKERIRQIQDLEYSPDLQIAKKISGRVKQIDSIKKNIHLQLIKELSDDLGEKINDDEISINKLLRSNMDYKNDEFNKQLSENLTSAINLLVGELNKMIVEINLLIEKY